MVIRLPHAARSAQAGSLTADLIVALAILVIAALPMAFAFNQETQLVRAGYNTAVAMEIVDGEMEILKAGYWQSFPEGTGPYRVSAAAARNLPAGQFVLTREKQALRLEWKPARKGQGRPVMREVRLP